VVAFDGVEDGFFLAELATEVGADLGVAAFDVVIERFADVV